MIRSLLLAAVLSVPVAAGAETPFQVPDPSPRATCPVCGMFVAKYPEWVATVLYRDGHADHFDGAKDLFKYLFDLDTYAPGRQPEEMAATAVTEYYDLVRIDARTACYVIGSDVLGPMGHELVPFLNVADALEFITDHGGSAPFGFDEVTPELLERLDRGDLTPVETSAPPRCGR